MKWSKRDKPWRNSSKHKPPRVVLQAVEETDATIATAATRVVGTLGTVPATEVVMNPETETAVTHGTETGTAQILEIEAAAATTRATAGTEAEADMTPGTATVTGDMMTAADGTATTETDTQTAAAIRVDTVVRAMIVTVVETAGTGIIAVHHATTAAARGDIPEIRRGETGITAGMTTGAKAGIDTATENAMPQWMAQWPSIRATHNQWTQTVLSPRCSDACVPLSRKTKFRRGCGESQRRYE